MIDPVSIYENHIETFSVIGKESEELAAEA